MTDFSKPIPVDDVQVAFPAGVMGLMPKYEDIPEQFRKWPCKHKFAKFVSDAFYRGCTDIELLPREGVDQTQAMWQFRTILGSFEPKHEHKEAACVYLLSIWFEDIEWKPVK